MATTNLSTALADGLPPAISERSRLVDARPVNTEGEFVLYWAHHAMRVEENPALDIAMTLSHRLKKPLLVYQGLSGAHEYNNDRHITFLLESARDFAAATAERGIRHAFHMPERTNYPGPLGELAGRAAVVVTEDFPAQPFPRWISGLVRRAVKTPVVLVDTALILPMRLTGPVDEDSSAFQDATMNERDRRAEQPYPTVAVDPLGFDAPPRLPFEPVRFDQADIGALVASCVDLDHLVGPIADASGGLRAAQRRWRRFRREGLTRYGRSNGAADDLCRIEADLHYGLVSPMRIARESLDAMGEEAHRFVDEYLFDRELAWSFCFHRSEHQTIDAIPDWARETLSKHERDHRPAIHDWETLSRGETEDEMWNLFQQALVAHGGLSRPLRHAWGRAILNWTTHAEEALRLALDLYQRYALDGGDPSAYTTILECFGLFDRPVTPDRPITGAVRPSSMASLKKRIGAEALRRRIRQASAGETPAIAVIGAGVAGLIAARTLADHQFEVRVFERRRIAGGRCVTREAGGWMFDLGAQFFSVHDGRIARYVEAWTERGVVDEWPGVVVDLVDREWRPTSRITRRLVGTPGMGSIPQHLARSLDVEYEVEVHEIVPESSFWRLRDATGRDLGEYDAVIVGTPAIEAAALLDGAPALASHAASNEMKPCWAVMLAFDDTTGIEFDAAYVFGSPLGWIARDSSKPGRTTPAGRGESWVLHASHDWSATHFETQRERVVKELFRAFVEAVGVRLPRPSFAAPYRWATAAPVEEAPVGWHPPCLWDDDRSIGACGDWLVRGRLEGALISGMAVAGRALRTPIRWRADDADELLSEPG